MALIKILLFQEGDMVYSLVEKSINGAYMKIPSKVPEKGFYYHYKHDPNGEVNNYAYEVMGVGVHTEDDCRPDDAHMVVYRPLYSSSVYKAGKLFDLRPLLMWMGTVMIGGKVFPRFQKIIDLKTIALLEAIKKDMYD